METLSNSVSIQKEADDWFGILVSGTEDEKRKMMDYFRAILDKDEKDSIDRMLFVLRYSVWQYDKRKELITKAFFGVGEEELLKSLVAKGFQLKGGIS